MNLSLRRKPLALLICYGFAGTLIGASSTEVFAQAAVSLRVDPVLLGLPPIKPVDEAAAKKTQETDPSRVEVRLVEAAVVEARTVEPQVSSPKPVRTEKPAMASPKEIPARARAPEAAPAVATPSPAPMPGEATLPVVAAPAPKPREEERAAAPLGSSKTLEKAPEPVVPSAVPVVATPQAVARPPVTSVAPPVPVASAPRPKVSSLEPLRVDPAVLGLPPVAAVASVTPVASVAANADARGATTANRTDSRLPVPGSVGSLAGDDDARSERDASASSDPTPALVLRASRTMEPLQSSSAEPRPTFLSAQRMGGDVDREFVAEGEAELRKVGTVVNAERLTYWPIDDEIEAEGEVRLEQPGGTISGPKMRLRMEDQIGYFEQPTYILKRQSATATLSTQDALAGYFDKLQSADSQKAFWSSGFASPSSPISGLPKSNPTMTEGYGTADRIDFEGENQIRLTNGTYSTCAPGNNDWYAKARDLKLDYDHEVAEGKDGTVYFMDTPILYSPWLSFSLNNQRKSGFLLPSIGTSSDNGFEYTQPYYWNIAPNMDATISPRLMTKRGVQLNNEFRYLNTLAGGRYEGKVALEFLPSDQLKDGDDRYGISLVHKQDGTSNGFSGTINYNKVSDDDYYTDLSSSITSTSQTQLLQQGMLTYSGGGWWSSSINFQQYQTLQPDADNPVLEQYRMLPQITFNARQPDFYLTDSSFLGQYTVFTKREQTVNGTRISDPDGNRTVLYPQLALPYVTPGWYVTPKVGVNYRNYSLSNQAAGVSSSISSTLPIFSVDSGMTFEKPSNWFGRDYTQTLEPRLYYLYVPYKNQDDIPLFDTSLADFNFAQIFSENQFSGWDRINDANQLTAAVTSRLLEPATGNEIMRAMLGQRFYFSKTRVGLTSTSVTASDDTKWDRSDILAAFSGQILPRVYADTAVQYDLTDQNAERYSIGMRYQPEPGKVLNASYRYNKDSTAPINQVDFSGQWPLVGRWHGVGRLNYSFKDDGTVLSTGGEGGRIIESVAGLEYNGGCWVLRTVMRRQALTSADASTSFFVQLELNDFSRIGSNPLSMLKRNIQGYGLINQTSADPVFGE